MSRTKDGPNKETRNTIQYESFTRRTRRRGQDQRCAGLGCGLPQICFLTRFKEAEGGYRDSARLLGESCADKKWGATSKKNCTKIREISCSVNSGSVGAHGQLTGGSNGPSPETNTNSQRIHSVSHLLRSPWHPLALNCWSFRTDSNGDPGTLGGGFICTSSEYHDSTAQGVAQAAIFQVLRLLVTRVAAVAAAVPFLFKKKKP